MDLFYKIEVKLNNFYFLFCFYKQMPLARGIVAADVI